MPRIFIDLTQDETHWNGEIGLRIEEPDDLSGTDMALAIGDHQIVSTVSQAVTLFDVLDAWMNAGPVREIGAVRGRVQGAIRQLVEDRAGVFKRLFTPTFSEDAFVSELETYLGAQGLRFRMAGDEPAFDTLRDRAAQARRNMAQPQTVKDRSSKAAYRHTEDLA